MRAIFRTVSLFALLILLAACEGNQPIVNNVQERDANEIVVYLASKGIEAQKVAVVAGIGGAGPSNTFDISVPMENATEAMALLNNAGLPRRTGTTLLQLFAGSGLMTSDKEDEIRYQAGLAEQICNTVKKFDGVLDADVQISFPSGDQIPGVPPQKITAAVYIKHQGLLEDPNSHIETKVKRLLAGSVSGLSIDDVSVISDRARYADITLEPAASYGGAPQTYVSIWSIVMTKSSLGRFRFLFFTLVTLVLLLTAAVGWLVYKFYPQLLPKKQQPPTP